MSVKAQTQEKLVRDLESLKKRVAELEISESHHCQVEEALWRSEITLQAILEAYPVGICLTQKRVIEWGNKAFYRIFGYPEGSLEGTKTRDFYTEEKEYRRVGRALFMPPENERVAQTETRLLDKNGKLVDCHLQASPLDPSNPDKGYILAMMDITQRKRADAALREREKRFKYISFHDGLTGLYNRTFFEEQISLLDKNLPRLSPLSIISIDVDGLKLINDTFGHKAGDDLLVAVSELVSKPFRNIDIIARIGGDEFCVILPGVATQMATEKREEIIQLVDKYNSKNPTIPMSISIGMATSQGLKGESIYDIYQKADDNMYGYKLTQAGSPRSKVIDILLTALSERDFIAEGHVERLLKMADKMARRLKLSDSEKRNLFLLAKVHDMGKVGIPDEILFKPAKLTKKEYDKMKEHSRIGHRIASRSKELSHIANLILCHHEFWDGTGYPSCLKGEEIPMECRILSIMDAFDAMTSKRPGNTLRNKREAIKELRRCSGKQFEPELVEEFIRSIE